jgi:hypothetical protein
MEFEVRSKPRGFLRLPREIRDLIYSYIIPTDKLFIFLLVTDKPDSCTFDRFSFDRGYAFPTFETSIFRICHMTSTEATDLWLKKGHFRLEMGEYLGPRSSNPLWTISDNFISRMAHCDLRITVPFWPWHHETWPPFQETSGLGIGSWMLRRFLRRIVEAMVKGQSLRQIQIKVRDKPKRMCHVYESDHVPQSFINHVVNPSLLPLMCFDKFESVNVEGDMACLKWSSLPGSTYAAIIRGMYDQFLWEVAKLSGNPGALKNSQVDKDTSKLTGNVYNIFVVCEGKAIPMAIIPTEARLFQAYFDGDWYLWIR